MRMRQHTGAEDRTIGQFNAPTVGVIFPPRIGVRQGHVKADIAISDVFNNTGVGENGGRGKGSGGIRYFMELE